MISRFPCSLVFLALLAVPLTGAGDDRAFQAFFEGYCIDCHDRDTAKGDFHIELLKKIETPGDAEYWQLTLDNLHLGEMPPENKKQPKPAEVEAITGWIGQKLAAAAAKLAGHTGEVILRRLNRAEYENTIDDLFGVRGDFTEGFPADEEEEGFSHIGASLSLSAEQFQEYEKAAAQIIEKSVVTRPRPQTVKKVFSLHDYNQEAWKRHRRDLERRQAEYQDLTPDEKKQTDQMVALQKQNPNLGFNFPAWENGAIREPKPEDGSGVDAVIPFRASYAAPDTRGMFQVREAGWYRFKITGYAAAAGDSLVRLKVMSGYFRPGDIPDVVDVIHYYGDQPQTKEYRIYLQPNQLVKYEMLDGDNWAPREKLASLPGPFVAIREMEMEGPLIDQWPPRGHQLLLGKRDATQLSDADMPEILDALAPRLFRRPVDSAVTGEFARFYTSLRSEIMTPLEAFKYTAKAMLVSPHFLYHVEPGTSPDGYALANRLSYFLWRSLPGPELLALAESGKIAGPATLDAQVDKMLADKKAERFLKDFSGQWLRIDQVGDMQPDSNLYPEYDNELELAMVGETEAFLREMIERDLPLSNLVKSDWTMLNARMAKLYQVEGVEGNEFRRVALPAGSVRGGLLAQASILNVTSNGTVTSPVVRGSWILENLLGTPPSPPPPDVPAIEPDIRGATTIKEQLAKHRDIAQCAACHRKIDPHGMALENFDVIGGWREKYRALQASPNPRRPKLADGNAVDCSDSLPRLGGFSSFNQYRDLLLKKEDLIHENMAHKLAVFALGRKLNFADDAEIREIARRVRDKKAGLKTLIREIVKSDMFRRP